MINSACLLNSNLNSQIITHKNVAATIFLVTFVASGILLDLSIHPTSIIPSFLCLVFVATAGLSLTDLILTMCKKSPTKQALTSNVKTASTPSTLPSTPEESPSTTSTSSLSNPSTIPNSASPVPIPTCLEFMDMEYEAVRDLAELSITSNSLELQRAILNNLLISKAMFDYKRIEKILSRSSHSEITNEIAAIQCTVNKIHMLSSSQSQ